MKVLAVAVAFAEPKKTRCRCHSCCLCYCCSDSYYYNSARTLSTTTLLHTVDKSRQSSRNTMEKRATLNPNRLMQSTDGTSFAAGALKLLRASCTGKLGTQTCRYCLILVFACLWITSLPSTPPQPPVAFNQPKPRRGEKRVQKENRSHGA